VRSERSDEQPSVGVLVVNWNGWQDTLESYESVAASDYPHWTFVIVDNASTDQSCQMFRERIPDAVLIESESNQGFAGGCNLGISKIMELGLDYIFLLNNDATVSTDALGRLVSASLSLGDRAILGSVVRFCPSGQLQFFGSRRSEQSGRPHWYSETDDSQLLTADLIDTDFVFGAALFAPTNLFRTVGFFDKRFFLNFEETDWCYTAAAQGVPCYVVTSSTVHHRSGASLGTRLAPMQMYFLSRNRLLFYDKHASARYRFRGYQEVARELASRLLRKGSDPATRALLLAVRDYLLRRFGDCPDEVRELARKAAERPSVMASA
jgi:GT2 family glycosyltransferase